MEKTTHILLENKPEPQNFSLETIIQDYLKFSAFSFNLKEPIIEALKKSLQKANQDTPADRGEENASPTSTRKKLKDNIKLYISDLYPNLYN